MLTAILVTTTSDLVAHTGVSLRDAVAHANADAALGISDTITFKATLGSPTITLTQGQLELTAGTLGAMQKIDGGGRVTISGNNASRVFQVDTGAQAVLTRLSIAQGNSAFGGGVYNSGALTVNNSTLSGNTAGTYGGGIFNAGTLTVNQSTLSGNTAALQGGGIYTTSVSMATVDHSILLCNAASADGGGILNTGMLTVDHSILFGNSASRDGGAILNDGILTVDHSILTGNIARDHGGGIYNYPSSTLTVEYSAIFCNTASIGADLFNDGGIVNKAHSFIRISVG